MPFFNYNIWIPIKIPLQFVPKCPINNIPALVLIMAWHRRGDKPLYEPMMVDLPTHICVTRPQWVNMLSVIECRNSLNNTSIAKWQYIYANLCHKMCQTKPCVLEHSFWRHWMWHYVWFGAELKAHIYWCLVDWGNGMTPVGSQANTSANAAVILSSGPPLTTFSNNWNNTK